MNMSDREQIQGHILTAMERLQLALTEHKAAAIAHANADHAYRQAQSRAWVSLKADDEKRTEAHFKAMVDQMCDREMHGCRLAEANHEVAKELVRALQTQISAGQSILSAERAEANAIHYGQTRGA